MSNNENQKKELTSRQHRMIVNLIKCPTIKKACKKAGVPRSTLNEWRRNSPLFNEELELAKRRQFNHALGRLRSSALVGVKNLVVLAQSATNENIRLQACLELLKASNAYGARDPLTFDFESLAREGDRDLSAKVALEMFVRMISGEITVDDSRNIRNLSDTLQSKMKPKKKFGR